MARANTPAVEIVAAITSAPPPADTLSKDESVISPLSSPKLNVSAKEVPTKVLIAVVPTYFCHYCYPQKYR